MLTAIAFAEAGAATVAAAFSIWRWSVNARRAIRAEAVVQRLDLEVQNRITDIIELSGQITAIEKRRRVKPGPTKRAAYLALVASKTAELRGEVIA